MKQSFFIDTHKGITLPVMLVLFALTDQLDNPTAMVYLALHGTYGILWVLKSRLFPDKQWEQPVSWWYGLVNWGALTLYWIPGWIIATGNVQAPAWLLGLAAGVYTLGIFYHFVADMQKHVSLQLRPGFFEGALWARSRNPNYFGELLVYCGFSMLAMHWLPFAVIVAFLVFVWIPNMRRKDRSLSRYDGYSSYRRRSRWMIPFLV